MTQEEKQLLLKDLCARLPYYTELYSNVADDNWAILTPVIISNLMNADDDLVIKPYLRSMSSMTEDEKENLQSLHDIISDENYGDGYSPSAWDAITEWEGYCNSRHLDFRGLIKKGLALEAPKGMYKIK